MLLQLTLIKMKKFHFLLLCFLGGVMQLNAQERYIDELFNNVEVTSDILYTSNWNIVYSSPVIDEIPTDLHMDIYEPMGDTITDRPVIMIVHDGNFLPFPYNQSVNGLKTDMTIVEIANRLARKGYVVASVEYRLGWNPIAPSQPERLESFIQVLYKGSQDVRTANRFLRHTFATQSNPYGIDPNKIALFGIGSGAYISNLVAHLDDFAEIGNSFLLDESINGNIYGTSLGIDPTTGDTINLVDLDLVNYDSDFTFTTNLSGGLLDINMIDENSLPQIAYHVPTDPIFPCSEDFISAGQPIIPLFNTYGSCDIIPLLNDNGVNDALDDFNFSDPWTEAANANNGGQRGLMLFLSSDPTLSQPWTLFSEDNPNATMPPNNESAMLYIDTILGYWSTRSYQTFFFLGTDVEELKEVNVSIAPNPTSDFTMISSPDEKIIKIELFDLQGRLMQQYNNVNDYFFKLNGNELALGLYVVQIRLKEGVVTRKIVFD